MKQAIDGLDAAACDPLLPGGEAPPTPRRAGVFVADRALVADVRTDTSRRPVDLPAFMDAVMRMLGRA